MRPKQEIRQRVEVRRKIENPLEQGRRRHGPEKVVQECHVHGKINLGFIGFIIVL